MNFFCIGLYFDSVKLSTKKGCLAFKGDLILDNYLFAGTEGFLSVFNINVVLIRLNILLSSLAQPKRRSHIRPSVRTSDPMRR